jgi:glycosyltransferase involved in cell wall biosynthesis
MNKDAYIFIHFNNDFSGSPKVLKDLYCSQPLQISKKIILTNDKDGFLSGLPNTILVRYSYHRSLALKLLSYAFYQFSLFFITSHQIIKLRLRKNPPKLILNTMMPFSAAVAGKLFGATTIYYIHETDIRPNFLKKILRFFIEYFSNKVIYVSSFLSHKEKFIRPDQCIINPAICNQDPLSGNELKDKFNKKTILFVGSLRFFKGADSFIKLAKLLPHMHFSMALNSTKQELSEFKKTHSIPDNISFYLRPENLLKIYSSSMLCLNMTNPRLCTETFGMTLIEAMSTSTPVIAPPVGGPIEIVDKYSGLLIDPENFSLLSLEINKMASDYSYWLKFSLGAKKRSNDFNFNKFNDRVESEIKSYFIETR